MSMKVKDLTGKRFGKLTVVRIAERGKRKQVRWFCRCDCGGTNTVDASDLRKGCTKSCGCGRSWNKGLYKTPAYNSWDGMIQRCYNPKNDRYHRYGGRGIEVCDKWRNSFLEFHKDMGDRPEGKSIERIDLDGDYEPSNCKWATPLEQAQNTSTVRLFTHNGKTLSMRGWSKETGIPGTTLFYRLKRGMSIGEAITYKKRSRNKTLPTA